MKITDKKRQRDGRREGKKNLEKEKEGEEV